jgi:hypothetical protein
LKGPKDADVRWTKSTAASGDETNCAIGEKAIQTLEIEVIFERDMMVHRDISPTQPIARTSSDRHPTIVNTDQSPVARRVDREPDFLDGINTRGTCTIR